MIEYNNLIGLDFETYGGVSLPDHGLERYVADKTFTALVACTAEYRSAVTMRNRTFDFVKNFDNAQEGLAQILEGRTIVAHNAGFERRVLQWLGIDLPATRFIDSAVVARAAGAGGKLEAAAPQLLGIDKMEEGRDLMRLFSIPTKEKLESGDLMFNRDVVFNNPTEWNIYIRYCCLDATLGLRLVIEHGLSNGLMTNAELMYQAVTMEMNQLGWRVDVDKVEEMQRRYLENQEVALADFRETYDAHDLNLNSLKQLKEWCEKRGIKATSFNEEAVEKLAARIDRKLSSMPTNHARFLDYFEVLALLRTKQILGGSSLKKLQVILDTVSEEGRLKDQYLHVGAGQTWRTTGRSVQMQNLKRLPEPADMDTLDDPDSVWCNEALAENIRQVFTSSHPNGALVVGDFSSVESRGLAWLAGEGWKLDAYRQGKDLYKVLASQIYSVGYDSVLKTQRQTGKVGELSCGYGAGPGAVQSFAAGMGVEMSEAEASSLVTDWRGANPKIVTLWNELDRALHLAMAHGSCSVPVGQGFRLTVEQMTTPSSLVAQHPGAVSLRVRVDDSQGRHFLTRVFHGCYERGRSICYYKPSQLKGGDLWVNHFTDPKTKQVRFYSIYGGKLAGIVTQSFCRELFFRVLLNVHEWCNEVKGVDVVGQFHDEIVLDFQPIGSATLYSVQAMLEQHMTQLGGVPGFPLGAEIKHDYRYTK